jgi:hypothetical protein
MTFPHGQPGSVANGLQRIATIRVGTAAGVASVFAVVLR